MDIAQSCTVAAFCRRLDVAANDCRRRLVATIPPYVFPIPRAQCKST